MPAELDLLLRDGNVTVSGDRWPALQAELKQRSIDYQFVKRVDPHIVTVIVSPARVDRPGDSQPIPIAPPEHFCVQDEVIRLIEERRRLGVERYGQPLRVHNGRDALVDLRDELLDALCYVTQAIMERDGA